MADHCCASKGQELEKLAKQTDQRRVLVIVLVINAVMFILEFGAGIVGGSTALMADATDMLGDALVYPCPNRRCSALSCGSRKSGRTGLSAFSTRSSNRARM